MIGYSSFFNFILDHLPSCLPRTVVEIPFCVILVGYWICCNTDVVLNERLFHLLGRCGVFGKKKNLS